MSDKKLNQSETKSESIAIVPTFTIVSETSDGSWLQPIDSTACLLPEVNRLKPSEPLTKTSSHSSLDSNVKYDENVDMMPLMPIDPNNAVVPVLTESAHKPPDERWYIVALQVLFPFFMAGFGMVGAGVFLDKVTHWPLFVNIKSIFTLIPALLGLKGNLEMTLASRFSTQVNLGRIKDKPTIMSAVMGNFALTQAQAIVVGFLASVGAILLKLFTEKILKTSSETTEIDFGNSLVLIAGCMSTASFASLILAGLMMFIIILSKQININPDNIATPIAASLGDLVTLVILSYLCTFLYEIKPQLWLHLTVISVFLILIPVFIYYSYYNDFVRDVLKNGWTPILLAMVISSAGGFIMGYAISSFDDIAAFQPVVNGVGGNLVAIFASRLSTTMYKTSEQGLVPFWAPKKWFQYPLHTFFGSANPESKTAIILAVLAVPGHLLFYFVITRVKIYYNNMNLATMTPSFIIFYLSVAILQVILLLLICYWLVHLTWRKNMNPDNVCIPYLTAIGDLLGTAFLAFCFYVLYWAGETRLKTS